MSQSVQYSEPFETILNLLAIAVLVDKKERDKELIEFNHCAALHNQHLHPDKLLPPCELKAWFENRRSFLQSKLRSETAEDFKREMLSRISDRGLQRQVLTSIFNISVADYELADLETRYMQLALETWDSPLPDPTEVEVYA